MRTTAILLATLFGRTAASCEDLPSLSILGWSQDGNRVALCHRDGCGCIDSVGVYDARTGALVTSRDADCESGEGMPVAAARRWARPLAPVAPGAPMRNLSVVNHDHGPIEAIIETGSTVPLLVRADASAAWVEGFSAPDLGYASPILVYGSPQGGHAVALIDGTDERWFIDAGLLREALSLRRAPPAKKRASPAPPVEEEASTVSMDGFAGEHSSRLLLATALGPVAARERCAEPPAWEVLGWSRDGTRVVVGRRACDMGYLTMRGSATGAIVEAREWCAWCTGDDRQPHGGKTMSEYAARTWARREAPLPAPPQATRLQAVRGGDDMIAALFEVGSYDPVVMHPAAEVSDIGFLVVGAERAGRPYRSPVTLFAAPDGRYAIALAAAETGAFWSMPLFVDAQALLRASLHP
jgi:hypothetical protein